MRIALGSTPLPTAIEMCAGRPRALAGVKGRRHPPTEPTMPASGDAFSPDDQTTSRGYAPYGSMGVGDMIDAPRGAADHSRRPCQVQNETLSLSQSPQLTNPTKSLALARYPALSTTCRRRALGVPHDSRLLSARSLAISARARRGSVLMHYSIRVSTGLIALDFYAARPCSTVQCHPRQYAWLSGLVLAWTVCMQTTIMSVWPPGHGLIRQRPLSHLVWDRRWPISSKQAYRLATGSTSFVPCSPCSSLGLCIALSPPASMLRRPISHIWWSPAGRPAEKSQGKRY